MLELARLEELDFGSWHDSHDPEEPDLDRNRVLTLRRLFELVAEYPKPVELAVEAKHPTRHAGLLDESSSNCSTNSAGLTRVAICVHRYG